MPRQLRASFPTIMLGLSANVGLKALGLSSYLANLNAINAYLAEGKEISERLRQQAKETNSSLF